MDSTKTYAVGNGEITLTKQDAEELRIILQTEYLEKFIRGLIKKNSECFNFTPASLRHFVDEMIRINSDWVDYDSSYHMEIMEENIFDRAETLGLLAEEGDK
jgi:hypothetical protein